MGEGFPGEAAAHELSEDSSSFLNGGYSDNSMHSSWKEDLADDASSLSQNSSYASHEGPLYGLSSLMAELPIKRGLSSFFEWKSQSFSSLSDAKCIEDLAKKSPFGKKMKSSKSYAPARGLDTAPRPCFTPPGVYNKTIAKKNSCASSLMSRRSRSFLYSSKLPS